MNCCAVRQRRGGIARPSTSRPIGLAAAAASNVAIVQGGSRASCGLRLMQFCANPNWRAMAMQYRWVCSWPWLATPSDVDAASSARPRRLRSPRVDLRKLLDRAAVAADSDSSLAVQDNSKVWLPSPPPVEKPRAVHNAACLAYLGDSIYEVYVRRHFLTPPQNVDSYNKRVMSLVCCEAQDAMLQQLLKDNFLTDEERDVVRWGKNIETGQRRASRRAGSKTYSSASALETLIGYLYLTDQQRLEELMAKAGFNVDSGSLLIGFGCQLSDKSSS